jgi:hypothetical protein
LRRSSPDRVDGAAPDTMSQLDPPDNTLDVLFSPEQR